MHSSLELLLLPTSYFVCEILHTIVRNTQYNCAKETLKSCEVHNTIVRNTLIKTVLLQIHFFCNVPTCLHFDGESRALWRHGFHKATPCTCKSIIKMGFYFVWRLCVVIHFYNISWVYPDAGNTADDRDSSFTQCWASIIPCFNAYIPSPRSMFQSSWPLIPCSQNSLALKENLGNPSAVEHSWASHDELTFFFHFLFSEVLTFLFSKIHSVSRLYLYVFQTLSLRYNFRYRVGKS